MDRAGAALPVITTLLCTGKAYCFADAIQESGSRIDVKLMVVAVDPQNYGNGRRDVGRGLVYRRGTVLYIVRRIWGFVFHSSSISPLQRRRPSVDALGILLNGIDASRAPCVSSCHA